MPEPVVLAYHGVSSSWDDYLSVPPDQLEWQIQLLVRRGYRPTTFREVRATNRHERVFAVTFDDGFRSTFEQAFPVLARLGVQATLFVPTDFVGIDEPMSWPGVDHWLGTANERELLPTSWNDIRALVEEGWEIGSHTCSHARLPGLDDAALSTELTRSRARIEEMLGIPCTSLAYPYGDHDERVVAAAARAGYTLACTLPSAFARAGDLTWPRIGIYPSDGQLRYRAKISGAVRALRRTPAWRAVDHVRSWRGRRLSQRAKPL